MIVRLLRYSLQGRSDIISQNKMQQVMWVVRLPILVNMYDVSTDFTSLRFPRSMNIRTVYYPLKQRLHLPTLFQVQNYRVELELLQHQIPLSQSHFHSPFQKYVTILLLSYCLFSFLMLLFSTIIKYIYIFKTILHS